MYACLYRSMGKKTQIDRWSLLRCDLCWYVKSPQTPEVKFRHILWIIPLSFRQKFFIVMKKWNYFQKTMFPNVEVFQSNLSPHHSRSFLSGLLANGIEDAGRQLASIVGGLWCTMFGMIAAVGLSNLQHVDLDVGSISTHSFVTKKGRHPVELSVRQILGSL